MEGRFFLGTTRKGLFPEPRFIFYADIGFSLGAAGFDSERLTAHSLRHTAITQALLAGSPLQEVQQFARHSSINTMQTAKHVSWSDTKEALSARVVELQPKVQMVNRLYSLR
jgi:integrase